MQLGLPHGFPVCRSCFSGFCRPESSRKSRRPLTERSILLAVSPLGPRQGLAQSISPPLLPYFIVGMENSAPSLTPDGQREVTVLVRV